MGLKIRGKTVLLMVISVIILSVAINILVYNEFNKYITRSVLTSDAKVGLSLMDERLPGDWTVTDNKLYKGKALINDNSDLVDGIKKSTGTECTIFLNDTRIATTVLQDGKRAVNTKASATVVSEVLNNGNEYIGDATVLNQPYKAVYTIIKDSNGKAVGMFFIGVAKSSIDNEIKNVMNYIMLISLVMLALIVLLSILLITKVIITPLKQLSKVIEKAAKGDMTVRANIKSKDEVGQIGKDINSMINSINGIITDVESKSIDISKFATNLSNTSNQIAQSSQEVATAISEDAQGASQQAANLADISKSLERFNSALESIYNSMTAVKEGSDLTKEYSNAGSQKLEELTSSIKVIHTSFDITYQRVTSLNEQIKRIDEIAASIKAISDQTNMLSLNAAIEAARAGEAGKGFSVVAQEIKALAEQSKDATDLISQLVSKIAEGTNEVVSANNMTREKLNSQIQTVDDTTKSFESIIKSVLETAPMLDKAFKDTDIAVKEKNSILSEIQAAASVAEQTSASAQEISASSEEMTAATEEVAATAERLHEISNVLVEKVKVFKV